VRRDRGDRGIEGDDVELEGEVRSLSRGDLVEL